MASTTDARDHGAVTVVLEDERLGVLGADVERDVRRGRDGTDVAQQFEGLFCDSLVVFVIADHPPAEIGRDDFSRQKVFSRKRTFARPAGADEHDE